jgi:hypothetical protein
VSETRAAATARAMRGETGAMTARAGRAANETRRATTTRTKAKRAASPRRGAKRAKTKRADGSGGTLGRLNLLTRTTARGTAAAVVPVAREGVAANAARVTANRGDRRARDVEETPEVEDDVAADDIDDDAASASSAEEDAAPRAMGQENVESNAPGGLGALAMLPKMSSPTFAPRSSVGASMMSQRNRSRNTGSLTTRLQRVLQNARASHAQFLKRVGAAQPPSSRGALLFTVNASRPDASLTNCAGSICDLHRATSDETDGADVEYARAVVIFNSTQAQELSLEPGRRVAVYPPWREIDLPGRVDETTSAVNEDVPRVFLCCENVLRLD